MPILRPVGRACQGESPKDLQLTVDRISGEDGAESQRGVLIKHPWYYAAEVEVYRETCAETREEVLLRDGCLSLEQNIKAFKFALEEPTTSQ